MKSSRGSYKSMRALDGKLKSLLEWPYTSRQFYALRFQRHIRELCLSNSICTTTDTKVLTPLCNFRFSCVIATWSIYTHAPIETRNITLHYADFAESVTQ